MLYLRIALLDVALCVLTAPAAAQHGALDPAELITALVEAGQNHAQGRRAEDDVTILVIGVR